MASPAPAISTPATRRPVRPSCRPCARNITQFTGILTINPDGSLFCNSLRTNRTLDLRDRAYFKQALVAHGIVTLRARIRPVDGDIGVADRLPGAPGIRGAEIHPARVVQSAEIRRVSREALGRTATRFCLSTAKAWSWCAPGKRRGRAGRIDCEFGTVPICDRTEPRTVPRGDRPGWPNPGLGRRPLAFDPRCRTLYPGRTIQGRTGRRPPTAACTRIWRCSRWPRCCCSRACGFWRP